MKVYIQLFLFVITVTCQANLLPLNRQLVARQGVMFPPSNPYLRPPSPVFEKLLALTDIEKGYILEEPDPKTLLIPDAYKPGFRRSYIDPVDNNYALYNNKNIDDNNSVNLLRQSAQHREHLTKHKAQQHTRLAEIDREALSKITDSDRELLLSQLTQDEREALLTQFDRGYLGEVQPLEENRFGIISSGFARTAAKIGAGAGSYIGGKLAGALGAKLGAAAGAYLGAAAANRFNASSRSRNNNALQNNNISRNRPYHGRQYIGRYGRSYGAL